MCVDSVYTQPPYDKNPPTRMTLKRLRCFVVGCNNEHSSRHLFPSSEPVKRIMFGSEGNTPSIYLNASMLARIIRDPAW